MTCLRLLLFALPLWSATAIAAPGPGPVDYAAYQAAGAKFENMVQTAATDGDAGRLHAPEVRTLVRELSDEERWLGPAFDAADLETKMGVCDVTNRATVMLAMFGLKQ